MIVADRVCAKIDSQYGKTAMDLLQKPVYVTQDLTFTELFGIVQRQGAVDAPVPVVASHGTAFFC